ncbi:Tubulin alpha chain [Camelus dromedarius]|uniref:Tubulin alpha chain n=1 Tax=Camelus dromedarius TaxID=9838 RepID=A0A5N4CU29_CAMDR|nr:Tubulin alpha chain [Camelus dromedarius]
MHAELYCLEQWHQPDGQMQVQEHVGEETTVSTFFSEIGMSNAAIATIKIKRYHPVCGTGAPLASEGALITKHPTVVLVETVAQSTAAVCMLSNTTAIAEAGAGLGHS